LVDLTASCPREGKRKRAKKWVKGKTGHQRRKRSFWGVEKTFRNAQNESGKINFHKPKVKN